jgi:translation initiation factor IF-3
LINPTSDPPVCKIVDYQKFRYTQEKKAKETRKNSKTVEVKEIKMSYKIDVHDYDVRKKSALKFLKQGNRVKCTVMFRGREVQHDALGYDLLNKLAVDLDDTCLKEGRPKKEGRNLSLIFGPRPEVLKAVNDNRKRDLANKKKEKAASLESKGAVVVGLDGLAEMSIDDEDDDDEDEEFDDDFEDDFEDDEDDDDESLEALLGTDDLTDALFG